VSKSYLTPDEAFNIADDDEAYLEIIHHHPEVFAAQYFDLEIEPYHAEMLNWGRDHERSLIRVPAQHGKSTLESKVLPAWEIVCNPNVRIILIMKTEKDAFSYSEQIRNKLADPNELIVKHFGPFYDTKQTWTNAQFNVVGRQIKDPHYTMEFYGAGGAVLGHRCEITICDDVVTEETAKTIGQRETQLKWFREQVQTGPQYMWPREVFAPEAIRERLLAGDETMARWVQHRLGTDKKTGYPILLKVPEGIYWPRDIAYQRVIVCGTTFHPKDLYNDLKQDDTYAPLYFDCYVTDPETGERAALWPGQMPLEKLEAEKESSGTLSFNKRFRNIALDEGELVFKEAFIHGGTFEGEEYAGILDRESGREWGEYDEKWFRTFGLDPASGGSSRFCTWPSAVVLGTDEKSEKRTMHFIDIFRSQMGIEDIISLILDGRAAGGIPGFYSMYKYQRGLIETNACQRWLMQHHRVTEAMEKDSNLHLEPHNTGGNKWDEVMGMSSIVRYCQNSQYSVPYSTPAARLKARPLLEQFEQFPKGIFDFVMAAWFATLAAEAMVTQYESYYMPGHTGRMVANPVYLQDYDDSTPEEDQEGWMSDRRKRLLGLL
jgi:hypothetical protein